MPTIIYAYDSSAGKVVATKVNASTTQPNGSEVYAYDSETEKTKRTKK